MFTMHSGSRLLPMLLIGHAGPVMDVLMEMQPYLYRRERAEVRRLHALARTANELNGMLSEMAFEDLEETQEPDPWERQIGILETLGRNGGPHAQTLNTMHTFLRRMHDINRLMLRMREGDKTALMEMLIPEEKRSQFAQFRMLSAALGNMNSTLDDDDDEYEDETGDDLGESTFV